MPLLLGSLRLEVFYPDRRVVQLQTPLLQDFVTAVRVALSAAYRGTPPSYVSVAFDVPPGTERRKTGRKEGRKEGRLRWPDRQHLTAAMWLSL